ncbi:MAG: hypothetical protein EXX96DRAFT_203619 [Benjaminiella poitrasii]|nr:MAG: hypothetical protein EXX96DRAFT_203619 [Benjaminiella poitrasii]
MGVQDVVARLNKSKTTTTTTTVIPLKQKSIFLTSEKHQFPPSPSPSPTSTISANSSNNQTHNISANGISTLLQKFSHPTQQQSSSLSPPNKLPTPPESPVITLLQQNSHRPLSMSQFDTTAAELVDLFQIWIDQHQAAEERIRQLEVQVEKYASDATKVRDYEIRVEYLAVKLEQVSEERDHFEQQYQDLLKSQMKSMSSNSPLSPAFSHIDNQKKHANDMNDILNVYEEISDIVSEDDDAGDELKIFEDHAIHEEQKLEQERGIQQALMKYITDLEKQRLETNALKEVIKKQDELISKMELKMKENVSDNEEMLIIKEQVEVQRIELENKRELLSQLLNEREDLQRKLNNTNKRSSYTPLRKSSMEHMFNKMNNQRSSNNSSHGNITTTARPNSFSSISSGRGTPPLTAPPKQPLPPLPSTTTMS